MRRLVVVAALAWPLAACSSNPSSGPSCTDPAPLAGTFDPRAPGYIVQFHDGVDATAETARLEGAYGFTAAAGYTSALDGFAANLDDDVRDSLRCESTSETI
jgi:hypothetical protein